MGQREALVQTDGFWPFRETLTPLLSLKAPFALASTFASNDGFQLYLGDALAIRQRLLTHSLATGHHLPPTFSSWGPSVLQSVFAQLVTREAFYPLSVPLGPSLDAEQTRGVAGWARQYGPRVATDLFTVSHVHNGAVWVPLSLFAPLERTIEAATKESTMPALPRPNSQGRKEKPGPTQGGTPPQRGGEIMISDAEAAVLLAYDSEEDPKKAAARAEKDSGFKTDEARLVHQRGEQMRRKGYSLKSTRGIFKPIVDGQPDTHAFVANARPGASGSEIVKGDPPAKKDTVGRVPVPSGGS